MVFSGKFVREFLSDANEGLVSSGGKDSEGTSNLSGVVIFSFSSPDGILGCLGVDDIEDVLSLEVFSSVSDVESEGPGSCDSVLSSDDSFA